MSEERINIQRYSKTFKLFKIQDLPGNIFYHTNYKLKHPKYTNYKLKHPKYTNTIPTHPNQIILTQKPPRTYKLQFTQGG